MPTTPDVPSVLFNLAGPAKLRLSPVAGFPAAGSPVAGFYPGQHNGFQLMSPPKGSAARYQSRMGQLGFGMMPGQSFQQSQDHSHAPALPQRSIKFPIARPLTCPCAAAAFNRAHRRRIASVPQRMEDQSGRFEHARVATGKTRHSTWDKGGLLRSRIAWLRPGN